MTRVKGGTVSKTRRRKVLKQAKGYFGSKHRLYKTAQEQLFHSGAYAYRDRKQNKRNFRKLWITRINAACRENNISYSRFINGLNIAGVTINRKMLSELAISNPQAFSDLVVIAQDALKTGKKLEQNTTTSKAQSEKKIKSEEKKAADEVDYDNMKVSQLKELARQKKIAGYSTMKKAQLIDALK